MVPLQLAELPPDALGDICAHLPPCAFARLLRCCQRLHSWGSAWPQVALSELDLRHLAQRLTDSTLEKAARRYPAISTLQLDCFALSELGLNAVAGWQALRDLRLVYIERHTDALLAPLVTAAMQPTTEPPGAPALGIRLTALSLSIGSNTQTCKFTDAGIAAALIACPSLQRLSLDVGKQHRMEAILGSFLMAPDAATRPALAELELAGHYLGRAVELCFPRPGAAGLSATGGAGAAGGGAEDAGDAGDAGDGSRGLTRRGYLNAHAMSVLTLHERDWEPESIVDAGWNPKPLLLDRHIQWFLRPECDAAYPPPCSAGRTSVLPRYECICCTLKRFA
jgi:hypothetical protein